MEDDKDTSQTQKLTKVKSPIERLGQLPETPLPSSSGTLSSIQVQYKRVTPTYARPIPRQDIKKVRQLEEQCQRFCLSLFFREEKPVRSVGITSSIPGEGKTFVAAMTAQVLAADSLHPVTLVELDWDHPGLHRYFDFSVTPGIAEWLRGECVEGDIRYPVSDNLSVIPAGEGQFEAVRLLQRLKQQGILETLANPNGLLVVDLPAVTTTAYSLLAATMLEALAIVTRVGVTPDDLLAQTCIDLRHLPVEGIILNRIEFKRR